MTRSGAFVIVAELLLAVPALNASPITSTWSGGAGNWSDPASWAAPSGVPLDGYQVLINNTSPLSIATVDVATPVLNNVGVASQASLVLAANLSAGEITSFGRIDVGGSATMNVSQGGFVQDTPTAALIVLSRGSVLDLGTYSQGGGLTLIDGTVTTSLFHVTGGNVTTGAGGALLVGNGGYVQDLNVSTLVDSGGRAVITGDYSQGNGTLIVNGSFSTSLVSVTGGNVAVGPGGQLIVGSGGYAQGVTGTATAISSGGQLTVSGSAYSQEIGTSTLIDGALTANQLNNSGLVTGDGTVNAYFRNLGTLEPGDDGAPGVFTINGQYAQHGFLDIDIDGPNSNSELNISDGATLHGTLDVSVGDGFTPQLGSSFVVMTYSSFVGAFDDIVASGLEPGEFWDVSYEKNDVLLTLEGTANSASLGDSLLPTPESGTFLTCATALGVIIIFLRIHFGPQLRAASASARCRSARI